MARRYEMKQRAERQQATRQRIVEAAVELHQSVGPARTTVTALAERAGVGRLTVYRHFPDDLALLSACSGLFWERNPFPDVDPLRQIANREERFRQALEDAYAYHERTEEMVSRALADVGDSPVFQPYLDHWVQTADLVAAAWSLRGQRRRLLLAAIGHGLSFTTWQSLARHQGLTNKQAIEVALRLSRDRTSG